ncbi:hypothetical protein F4818DRAFT_452371 [Hypoxylon cercidicola]|nr:hypothetical protein F4818DRAFT_452371 [Hypoxylon cercidicola]
MPHVYKRHKTPMDDSTDPSQAIGQPSDNNDTPPRPKKTVRFAYPLTEIIETEVATSTKQNTKWELSDLSSFDGRRALRSVSSSHWMKVFEEGCGLLQKLRNLECHGAPAWGEVGAAAGLVRGVPRDELRIAEDCIEFILPDLEFLGRTNDTFDIKWLREVLTGHQYFAKLHLIFEQYICEIYKKCLQSVESNFNLARKKLKSKVRKIKRAKEAHRKVSLAAYRPYNIGSSPLRSVTSVDDFEAEITPDTQVDEEQVTQEELDSLMEFFNNNPLPGLDPSAYWVDQQPVLTNWDVTSDYNSLLVSDTSDLSDTSDTSDTSTTSTTPVTSDSDLIDFNSMDWSFPGVEHEMQDGGIRL